MNQKNKNLNHRLRRFILLWKTNHFLTKETEENIMSGENSVDIDTEMDFAYCEWLFNKRIR